MTLQIQCTGLLIEPVGCQVFIITLILIRLFLALKRHGSWRVDFNVELVTPFTRNIAHSWSKVFESDLFAPFEKAAFDVVKELLKQVEESAAPGLKDRAKLQGDQCLEEAHVALKNMMDIVKATMANEQKEVSRCMAPHVQNQLVEGYDTAMEERGKGSVARQKVGWHFVVLSTAEHFPLGLFPQFHRWVQR